jgi:hypothetical protein
MRNREQSPEPMDERRPEPVEPERERIDESRRGFLRLAGASAALFAVEGCAAKLGGKGTVERMAELIDRREPFMKRWRVALEEGLAEFEGNEKSRAAFGEATSKELVEAIRSFDIEEYIATLAREGNVRPEEIGGEILSLRIAPEGAKGTMAAVTELRHMNIYGGEWMKYKGGVHKPTIHAVVRHELAHIFSFNYEAATLPGSLPLVFQYEPGQQMERAHISEAVYEGLTEVIARSASLKAGEQSVEQGYRGGGTLSAFVLRELLGRQELTQVYLRHDSRQLKRLFKAKLGEWSDERLASPINIVSYLDSGYDQSLDLIHHAFTLKEIGPNKMAGILETAKQEGIHERVEHDETGNISTTTHLYEISDADEPAKYLLNAVAEGPEVYRFSRAVDKELGNYEPKESFSMVLGGYHMLEGDRMEAILRAAQMLKKQCEIKNPREASLGNAFAEIGYDSFINERLMLLNGLEENNRQFEKIWKEINTHAIELVAETVRKIYDQAGVTDLVVEKGGSKSK